MRYIQCSTLSLPSAEDADRSLVFPCIAVDGDGSAGQPRSFALLVSDRNHIARGLLELLGFEEDPNATVPEGKGLDDSWSFFRSSGGTAPVGIFADEAALDAYVEFEFTDGESFRPETITIADPTLNDGDFNAGQTWFQRLKLQGLGADGSNFSWATADQPEIAALSFRFASSTVMPLAAGESLPVSLSVSFERQPDDGGTWGGGVLRLNADPNEQDSGALVVGSPGDRLIAGQGVLVSGSDGNGGIVFHYDFLPETSISIPTGESGLFDVELDVRAVSLRFKGNNAPPNGSVGMFLFPGPVGGVVPLTLRLKIPLVMAPFKSAADGLALIVPLVDPSANSADRSLLDFSLVIGVGDSWNFDEPLWEFNRSGAWELNDDFVTKDGEEDRKWDAVVTNKMDRGFSLGGFAFSMEDLLGEALGAVGFSILPPTTGRRSRTEITNGVLEIPLGLQAAIAGFPLRVDLKLRLDLKTLRLESNRLNFRFPRSVEGEVVQTVDLKAFALLFPLRPPEIAAEEDDDGVSNSLPEDGYIDFEQRVFAIRDPEDGSEGPWVVLPGGLNDDFSNRLIFQLQGNFRPDSWPKKGKGEPCYFRVNGNGVSFHAKVLTSHQPTVFRGDESRTPLSIRPHEEREERASEIVIIDNAIRLATIYGEMDVPGFDDLTALVDVGLRQERKGAPPIVHAGIDLDKKDGSPLAQMTPGYLQVILEDLRARLEWDTGTNEWDLEVFVDGSASLAPKVNSTGGIDGLNKETAIVVRDLNLMELHKGAGTIALRLANPVEFSCLNDMFAVRLDQLQFGWGSSFVLACETAAITFQDPGAFEVTIEVGGLHLEFSGGNKLKMRNPKQIGIEGAIGDSVKFRGAVAWVDDGRERYFGASVKLDITGLPKADTLVKIGTGRKANGQAVPNIVLYGAADKEVSLFTGVVAKSFGAGIGINNRLTGIGERPNAESILANIDRIDPSRLDGWEFVERNGFFLSIVGSTILGSSPGGNSSQNAYVASLILSVDIDLNVVAAGKVWLFSSVDFVRNRDNWNRPALLGAIAMSPKQEAISAAFESRRKPAIETNDQLAKILDRGRIKLSFLMAPSIVDFFLEEVSYKDDFLGFQMEYRGSLRFSVFRRAVLLRASQSITGRFSRTLGNSSGGFSAEGDLMVLVEFGGLISRKGLAAYALVDIGLNLRTSAFIKIEFSITIGSGRWKRSWSYSIKFILPPTQLELGLRGAVAFDESGKFGFSGSLSISVPICGYRLSISPSLRFNNGVITEVRNRVAAFERRIEAHRRKILGEGGGNEDGARLTRAADSSDGRPEYLLFERSGRHLIVPAPGERWLTPEVETVEDEQGEEDQPVLRFEGGVEAIEIVVKGTGKVKRVVYMPWIRNHWEGFEGTREESEPPLKNELEVIEAMMAETVDPTLATEAERNAFTDAQKMVNYEVKTDPRIESTSREYWTDEDRIKLPEYCLPIRMRPADEVLSGEAITSGSASDYERLVDYIYWRTRATRIQRHEGQDVDDQHRTQQNRGAVLQHLVGDVLASAADEPLKHRGWIAREAKSDPVRHYGYVFQLPDDLESEYAEFRIRRQHDYDIELVPLGGALPDTGSSLVVLAKLDQSIHVRIFGHDGTRIADQEHDPAYFDGRLDPFPTTEDLSLADRAFLIDKAASASAVALGKPIEPTRTADQLKEIRKMVTLAPPRQQFVVDQDSRDRGDARERGRVVVKLPVSYQAELFTQHLPTLSHFRVWRQIVSATGAVSEPTLVGDIRYPEMVQVNESENGVNRKVLVVGPYIFTDEFPVEDRDLVSPDIIAGETEIRYTLGLVPTGAADSEFEDALTQASVKLHIPERDVFPDDLAIIFPASSLFLPSGNAAEPWGEFSLASISGDRVTLATVPDKSEEGKIRALLADEFELWIDERPIAASGFYAGADEDATNGRETKTAALINDVRVATVSERFETTDGKFKVGVASVDRVDAEPGLFKLVPSGEPDLIKLGTAYRFFIRPVLRRRDGAGEQEATGLLRPLPVHLLRQFPQREDEEDKVDWVEPPRTRLVSQVEWIPKDIAGKVEAEEFTDFKPAVVTASRRPLDRNYLSDDLPEIRQRSIFENLRWSLGLSWESGATDAGGVEILVRDKDDSVVGDRILVETKHEDVFRQSVQTFENAAAWDLTPAEKSKRIAWSPPTEAPDGGDGEKELEDQLLLIDAVRNPALAGLVRKTTQLERELQSDQEGSDWQDVVVAAKNYMTAVYIYRKSPLNLEDEPVREAVDKIELLLRCLVLGFRDDEVDDFEGLGAEARQGIVEGISDLLSGLEDASVDASAHSDETETQRKLARAAFLDLEIAQRATAIVRRRDVIAEEIFSNSDDHMPLPPDDVAPAAVASWLPRGNRFENLRQRMEVKSSELSAAFDLSSSLFDRFPPSERSAVASTWAAGLLLEGINKLHDLALFVHGDEDADGVLARKKAGASIVTKAAGLTVATNRLRELTEASGWKLIKRPHHQVGVGGGDGEVKEPQPTPIESLLSNEAQLDRETGSGVAEPDKPSKEVVSYFNLLERMGFALDLAAIDQLNERITQQSLLDLIERARLPEALSKVGTLDQHQIFVLTGREPDSDLLPDQSNPYVGHSFLKLAVVPNGFHDRLASRLAEGSDEVDSLKEWFSARAVDLGDSVEEEFASLVRLSKLASFIRHRSPSEDEGIHKPYVEIRVESRDRRRVAVPSVGGRCGIGWVAPDQKGRRLAVVARHVPRYEPFIRWAKGMPLAAKWPDSLEDQPTSEISIRRLSVVHPDDKEPQFDLPQFLPVSAYPHPTKLLFSMILPSAGARSIYNVISAVRTGYKGYSVSFRHKLTDHEKERQQWIPVLKAMRLRPPESGERVQDPVAFARPTPFRNIADVRLFRHERLVTLPDLPYYYDYRMEAQSQYDVHYAKSLPPVGKPWPVSSSRPPGLISCRTPKVISEQVVGDRKRYHVELYLTRTGDLLTPTEWSNSPPIQGENVEVKPESSEGEERVAIELPHDRLPELAMAYQLYYREGKFVVDENGVDQSIYVFLCELLMPWHQEYKSPDKPPEEEDGATRPHFRSMDARIEIDDERTRPPIIVGASEHSRPDDLATPLRLPAYSVSLQFNIKKDPGEATFVFDSPERRRFRVARLGKLSNPLPLEEPS